MPVMWGRLGGDGHRVRPCVQRTGRVNCCRRQERLASCLTSRGKGLLPLVAPASMQEHGLTRFEEIEPWHLPPYPTCRPL